MAKKLFNVMLEPDDIELLNVQAKRQKVTPSALARILISDGLKHYGWQIMQMRETVNHLVQLVSSDIELSAAAVAASALHSSKGLDRKVGESVEDYKTRYYADLKENIHTSRKLGEQIQKSFAQPDKKV